MKKGIKITYWLAIAIICNNNVAAQSLRQPEQYSWNNLPVAKEPRFRQDTVNIAQYGAKPDGITLNTKSINEAIAACSKNGGGVVLVPGGLWLTGPVVLQDNVNLHLQRSAILQFTDDFNQYPLVEGNYEGKRSARNQSPISGNGLENIAITGRGTIDGNGDAWRAVNRDRLTASQWKKKVASGGVLSDDGGTWYPSAKSKLGNAQKNTGVLEPGKTLKDFEVIKDFLRPNLVVLTGCRKVLLEGVTFQNSPAWCLHPLLCEDLTVRNVVVRNPEYAQNGDGIDVESCRNLLIEGSSFDCGDDGICIKSGRDEEGRKRGRPTENAVIRNNIVYHAHGGFVIGSEMSGGARNIFVSDCSFMGTDKGLRFKTTRGRGGVVENIYIRNIYMKDIVGEAIFFDMYYFAKPPAAGQEEAVPPVTEATPQFRNMEISNIVCNGAGKGIFMRGLPEMSVTGIRLDNIILKAKKGIELTEVKDISLSKVQLVTGITDPVVFIENGSNITFNQLSYNSDVQLLFSVNGSHSRDISVSGTNTTLAREKARFDKGASSGSLKYY